MEILIVDDHPFIHETLRAVVEKAVPGATVAAESDLAHALASARRMTDLKLVLLDLGLPGFGGIEALRAFRKALPRIRIAIVSATDDPARMREALDAGAEGFIPKTSLPSLMVDAVRLIANGGRYVPPEAMSALPGARAAIRLTRRQADVLHLIIGGLHNRQIAAQLDISEDTVKQHAHAVFEKLGVTSRTEAIAAAGRLGIKAA